MEWRNLYRGAMMGISDLIPGVSGGTIAVLLGIYDQLITAINGLFSKDWKKHLLFLIPLGVGIVVAIFSLSQLIKWLLLFHNGPTKFFFLGLIAGIIPMLVKRAKVRETFQSRHYIAFFVAMAIVALMAFFQPSDEPVIITTLTGTNAVSLFLSGWLASISMLLPGISGSMVLLLLGVYDTAIEALATLNVPIIIVIGTGVVIGFFVSSRLIRYLLKTYFTLTYAIIIGLVVGSIFVIYPGFISTSVIFPSIITFIGGAATAIMLGSKDV